MNVKIPVFVICVEAIIYLLLYNLHDCTFKFCICHKLKTIVPASAKIFITTLAVILTLNKEILKNISQEQQIVHNIAKTLNKCLRICQRILNSIIRINYNKKNKQANCSYIKTKIKI